jgi:flagellar biosynthetic protein FlhB
MSLLQAAGFSGFMFLAAPAACVVATIVAQKAMVFAPSKLAFKWSRISIAGNAKQKFGPQGLSEFLISALKLVGVLVVLLVLFWGRFMQLPATALLPAEAAAPALHEASVLLLGAVVVFSVGVAMLDVVRVQTAHKKRLMMSLDEIRRESKETEGDPHMKQSRRERSRAIATNRMLLDVPKASVVIVNPTHYAVALKWDGPKTGAPVLVAKGVDEMAAKIREIASSTGVPIRRDAPVARAIFGSVEVGGEIRREHYAAVAAAIHFAEAMRKEGRVQ